ncbi:two-component system OmpR family sensor kinase [Paraburkholderia caballeronis]|uniref:sensor histidine kinase n=1 Tax=Paraburkholderia caballeronis TaxID=416943 RepID=UPI0010E603EE|nr:HAMP domain-containing sensor histidine kinase [Paraburkholderia caballeronis]TDV39672.1 two-component system OmpR family sensor kinase [Paraburkholderia caballeronis]
MFAANSLHRRLSLALGALAIVVGILGALGTFVVVRGLASEFNASLRDAASHIRAGTTHPATLPGGANDDLVVQIWSADDGAAPGRSSNFALGLPKTPAGFTSIEHAGDTWDVFALAAGDEFFQVAESRSVRNRNAIRVAFWSLLPVLALLPLLALTIAATVRMSLRPLDRIGRRAARIDLHNLQPLKVDKAPEELRPFLDSINRMIERLSALVHSERKFIADAAHELRSPISAMQLQIDNLRAAPPDQYDERLEELRRGIGRAASLVSQLLGLARAEIGRAERVLADVSLSRVVTDVVADLLPLAYARGVDLGVVQLDDATVRAVEADMRVLVRNLIDNAIRYGGHGANVDVAVRAEPHGVMIEVTDDGPGIADADLPRVFDRFFRAGATDAEGSGLGLAIAQTLAASYAGRVTVANRADGRTGVVARIELPRA